MKWVLGHNFLKSHYWKPSLKSHFLFSRNRFLSGFLRSGSLRSGFLKSAILSGIWKVGFVENYGSCSDIVLRVGTLLLKGWSHKALFIKLLKSRQKLIDEVTTNLRTEIFDKILILMHFFSGPKLFPLNISVWKSIRSQSHIWRTDATLVCLVLFKKK